MARIRSVKPEFWSDRKLAASVSRDARLLYIALWNQADEWGRVQGDTRWIKGHCLPYDDDLNLQAIDRLIDELAAAGRVQKYEHEDDPFLFLPKLAEHQRLEPAKVPSRLPEPPATPDLSVEPVSSESRADSSERRADSPGTTVALHVAGGMEHVAGGMEHVAPSGAAQTRKPDPIWDSLLAACGVDSASVTSSSRGAYNKAVADLRAVNAEPGEINRRASVFRDRWPDASLTPTALARRWAECDLPPPTRLATTDQRVMTGRGVADQLRAEGR